MTALIITLGFLAAMAVAMVVPGVLWSGAPDHRGEARPLHSVPLDGAQDDQLAA